ncbi:helix-turn-helix domain-containing protein (plasmid) [Coraliomargarita sp. W4R53]
MTERRPRPDRDGFTMIPDWLVESSTISLHDYAVLIVLMKHARRSGECYPGFATIAAQGRMSRDSVKRSIRSLESLGLIEIERRRVGTKNLPNRYTLHVHPDRVGAHSTHPVIARDDLRQVPTRGVGAHSAQVGAHSAQVGAHSAQGWVLTAPLTRLSNESHERDNAHRDATSTDDDEKLLHDDAISARDHTHSSASVVVAEIATSAQIRLMYDLHILIGSGIPTASLLAEWSSSNTERANQIIRAQYRDVGRGGNYSGPIEGEHGYDALSDTGKRWADAEMRPDRAEQSA